MSHGEVPGPGTRSLHLSYGGTFDPVHAGHLAVARSVSRQLDAVVHLVPCADPPHRAAPVASAQQRARMLELAIDGDPGLALDRRELRRAGASYTIDTLRELRAELDATVAIACIIGADAFRGLPGWRDWRRLFDLAHVVTLTRPGHTLERLDPALQAEVVARRVDGAQALRATAAGSVLDLAVPAWDLSSTEVRAALRAGRCPREALPPAVLNYIDTHDLYR